MFTRKMIVAILLAIWVIMSSGITKAIVELPGRDPSGRINLQELNEIKARYFEQYVTPVILDGNNPDYRTYVADEIIVKFKEDAANTVAEELKLKKSVKDVKINASIDILNKKYGIKELKPVFKNFKAQVKKFENLKKKGQSASY